MQTLKLIKKYETHSEYKDSGVEWLGKIPTDWSLEKLKNKFKFEKGKKAALFTQDYIGNENNIGNYPVYSGQTENNGVMGNINTYEYDLSIPAVFTTTVGAKAMTPLILNGKFNLSQNCLLMVPKNKEIDSRFFYYQLFSLFKSMKDEIPSHMQPSLRVSDLNKSQVAYVLFDKQKQISDYLDEKTSGIDQIIERKQKLIGILKEKRTSEVNSLIINAEGEKGKLKNYIQLNPSKKIVSVTGPEDMVSFVPMEAISELGELQPQERKYKDVSSGFTYFRNGDVVLAKITPCYENGKAGVMKGLKNDFGFGTTEFMVMRPSNKILADYLYYVVFSDKFRKMGEVEMRGTAGQKRVTSSFVMNYELSIPDIKTQEKIVTELNKKMKIFGVAIEKIEASISFLNEFKSALISNVVTGKIKV